MSIIDKVKEMLGQRSDKIEEGIDKAGDTLDEKTGGKYSDKIDTAQEKAKSFLTNEEQSGQAAQSGQPPQAEQPSAPPPMPPRSPEPPEPPQPTA